jgi:hypothetical protein
MRFMKLTGVGTVRKMRLRRLLLQVGMPWRASGDPSYSQKDYTITGEK